MWSVLQELAGVSTPRDTVGGQNLEAHSGSTLQKPHSGKGGEVGVASLETRRSAGDASGIQADKSLN